MVVPLEFLPLAKRTDHQAYGNILGWIEPTEGIANYRQFVESLLNDFADVIPNSYAKRGFLCPKKNLPFHIRSCISQGFYGYPWHV